MTLFVFLAAAARAGVVSADSRPLPNGLPSRCTFGLAVRVASPLGYLRLALPHLALQPSGFLRRLARCHPHHLADEVQLDVREHLYEAFITLLLVFLFGILLAIAPQADALAKVVHRKEVILPELVDG